MRACGGTWIAHGSGTADRETVDRDDKIARSAGRARLHAAAGLDHARKSRTAIITVLPMKAFGRCAISLSCGRSSARATGGCTKRSTSASPMPSPSEAKTEDPIVLVQDYHFALAPRMIRAAPAESDHHHVLAYPMAQRGNLRHLPLEGTNSRRACSAAASLAFTPSFTATISSRRSTASSKAASTASTQRSRRAAMRRWCGPIRSPSNGRQRRWQASRRSPTAGCRCVQALGICRRTPNWPSASSASTTPKAFWTACARSTSCCTANRTWKGKLTFVQVAAPTRSKLASYSALQTEAVALADDINARHGDGAYQPIRLLDPASRARRGVRAVPRRRCVHRQQPA